MSTFFSHKKTTFLLLGKLPTPSDYAAKAKSSFAKLSFAFIVLFAITVLTSGQLHTSTNLSVDPISTPL